MAHGKICYVEIPAVTGEASAAFYSSIFNWKVRQRGDGNLAFDDTGCVSVTWVK
jgi:predicted enzyme related to lactoylglutathione lyase